MTTELRRLRLQETLYPFGVGAIVDILGESFIAMDVTHWELRHCEELKCRPLQENLNVRTLRQPPLAQDFNNSKFRALPYSRFPRWRFCENCGNLTTKMLTKLGAVRNQCLKCSGGMVPMRFVAVCETGGHLQDVPWRTWIHRRGDAPDQKECRSNDHLYVRTRSGEGLSSVMVECRACRSQRHLGELAPESSLRSEGFQCWGAQPWQYQENKGESTCDAQLISIQRGSTSLHLARTFSALDIPEVTSLFDDKRASVMDDPLFDIIKNDNGPIREVLKPELASKHDVPDSYIDALLSTTSGDNQDEIRGNLLSGEWAAFEKAMLGDQSALTEDFVVEASSIPSASSGDEEDALRELFSDIGLVKRLREVVAITGFSRYRQENFTRVDLNQSPALNWYPAIERFGEGIFIRFREDTLSAWEAHPAVVNRAISLGDRALRQDNHTLRQSEITPRFILLHTFAHLLMRRLEFDSGYPASSLSERVYAHSGGASPQAGVLISATAGDKLGTLGGLVRLGEQEFIREILIGAVEDADFCSNDPVCMESSGQGMYSLNLAACHACSLGPETSCQERNVFLDRVLLVGRDNVPGFFADVLSSARGALAASED